ncbi:D-ribose pyranase [Novisyntrophococcus fermenticellae]|uniref:D-ribose pyranase n=1 Tax=Novisyntrophococcus fermenticellae TaxID=2068655 RepID=UPI001E2A626A|nr:D-ribose pyranase [Novisyntrophococcus fermenticellae]
MKKHGILNKRLMEAIMDMGHTDIMVIGDAGVPVQRPEQRVDLALTEDVPTIAEVLDLIMDEMIFEKVVVADEQKKYNPVHFKKVEELVKKRYETMEVESMPHEEFFAEYLPKAKYIVRTGNLMPWGNVVLIAGIDAKKWFEKEGAITPDYYAQRAGYDN